MFYLIKAYDSLDWEFIRHCLAYFSAPSSFVKWERECITYPWFSVSINGTLVGYFEGRRGLRQGNPLSPNLFVIAMEVLLRLMEEAVLDNRSFDFHPKCSKLHLTQLCFADDPILFSAADVKSVQTIKKCFNSFLNCRVCLRILTKVHYIAQGLLNWLKRSKLIVWKSKKVTLPVPYLGVPLISKKLAATDCAMLIEKITARIDSWLSKKLSCAGRLQFLSSMLYSIQVSWSSIS